LLQINARLSGKSIDAPTFVRGLLTTTLGYFSQILTRSEKDREALLALGADPEKIIIPGNLKSFDQDSEPPVRLIKGEYLILASSHEGEEREFLQQRPAEFDDLLLVIAPRHPNRSSAIQKQIDQFGLAYAVRSESQTVAKDTQVYLADTLGELKSLMAYARIVVMGGSFDNTGGHNLNEAAALGRAIITGPSDSNIAEDIDMLGNGKGILQVASMQQCWQVIRNLLDHPERAETLGLEAKNRLARQPDIISIYLQAIEPWYSTDGTAPTATRKQISQD
jgi:3-deoxy-D-manno-octulosonic-acid transferase